MGNPWEIPKSSVMRKVRKPVDPRMGYGIHFKTQVGKTLIDLPPLGLTMDGRTGGNTVALINREFADAGLTCTIARCSYFGEYFYYLVDDRIAHWPKVQRKVGDRLNSHLPEKWVQLAKEKLAQCLNSAPDRRRKRKTIAA